MLGMMRCAARAERTTLAGAENGTLFLSAFPMFVPSLSWQNDRFYIKMAQKCRFSQGGWHAHEVSEPQTTASCCLFTSRPVYLNFVCVLPSVLLFHVCPEPVLANVIVRSSEDSHKRIVFILQ
jgi:hypothetical protein